MYPVPALGATLALWSDNLDFLELGVLVSPETSSDLG